MAKHSTLKIGAHVSSAGGTHKAIKRVADVGGNCVQVFSGSPRSWRRPDVADIETKKLFAEQEKYQVAPIVTHAIYLVNLASDKTELVEKSLKVLEYDLHFDAAIKGSGVVVHLGSHTGRGWEAVREQVAENINTLLKGTPNNSTFLIENSAGQKGKLCSDLEHIRWLLDQVNNKRLGWCVDTCHAHAAGYGLGQKQPELPEKGRAENERPETLLAAIDRLQLWSDLKVVHVNDSRDAFGSGRDRHDNLGEGEIPQADFKHFLHNEHIRQRPLILEVPGVDGKGPDAENVNRLQQLMD